ncbi:MAG: hypothetical protein ABI067_10930 [Leifsonia sp.]
MDDGDLYTWRRAVLRYPDRELEHVIALVDGRPPMQLDTSAFGRRGWMDQFDLIENTLECATYRFTVQVPSD